MVSGRQFSRIFNGGIPGSKLNGVVSVVRSFFEIVLGNRGKLTTKQADMGIG